MKKQKVSLEVYSSLSELAGEKKVTLDFLVESLLASILKVNKSEERGEVHDPVSGKRVFKAVVY